MPGVLSEASFSTMRDELATTLRLLEDLGVEWKLTRFRRYLDSLSWAASLTYPRELAIADELAEQQLFFEASSQAQQLALSANMRGLLDGELLRDRLKRACRGPDLPEPYDDHDDARNTLLELATAAIFNRAGFRVELTEGREDLLASVPGLSPFAVECKRPVAARTFAANVKKLRRQLYQRCRDRYEHGIAVLGVDRAMGLAGSLREATSLADLEARLTLGLELTCGEMIRLGGPKLAAVAPAVVAVVTGCVFVEPVRGPVTFETLMLAFTGAQGSATRLKYETALSPFF